MALLHDSAKYSLLLQAVPALSVCYIIIKLVVNHFKLRQFNGPFWAGCSRSWMLWHAVNGRLNQAQFEAQMKFGRVCRIGPDVLMTNDIDILRHISAPRSKWRRSPWYDTFAIDPDHHSVVSTRDEKLHAELKSKEAGAYMGRDIDTLEHDIDTRTVEFMDLIKNQYANKSADVAELLRFYVLDVLSTVAFGRPFGFISANKDLWSYNKIVGDFIAVFEVSGILRLFQRVLSSSIIRAVAAPKTTDKTGMGPAMAFAHKAVAERFEKNAQVKKDMLGHFIKKGLDQKQCETEAFIQILAGSDSTSAILRCALYTLAGNPAAYRRLQDELDTAAESGKLSSPVSKFAEAQQLPYLHACIWESCRMFAPLFGLRSKVAPPEGEEISGIFFPGGVELTSLDEAVCRRRDIFGEDADLYRPDRWLEIDAEKRFHWERVVDLIFGSGRYLCLGRHIAMMEMHKAVAALVLHFEWSIAQPLKGVPTVAHGAWIQSDMNMVAKLRRPIAPLKI